jgi:hypothetical protein
LQLPQQDRLVLAARHAAEAGEPVPQSLAHADDVLPLQVERPRRAGQFHAHDVPVRVAADDLAGQVEERGRGAEAESVEQFRERRVDGERTAGRTWGE